MFVLSAGEDAVTVSGSHAFSDFSLQMSRILLKRARIII